MSNTHTKFVEGIGRRKTAVARVRVTKGKGEVTVNEKPLKDLSLISKLKNEIMAPVVKLKLEESVNVSAKVSGGGQSAQAAAVRHGLARALVKWDEKLKPLLRGYGYLTRDSRMVERKKYGYKKARRAPQWQKR